MRRLEVYDRNYLLRNSDEALGLALDGELQAATAVVQGSDGYEVEVNPYHREPENEKLLHTVCSAVKGAGALVRTGHDIYDRVSTTFDGTIIAPIPVSGRGEFIEDYLTQETLGINAWALERLRLIEPRPIQYAPSSGESGTAAVRVRDIVGDVDRVSGVQVFDPSDVYADIRLLEVVRHNLETIKNQPIRSSFSLAGVVLGFTFLNTIEASDSVAEQGVAGFSSLVFFASAFFNYFNIRSYDMYIDVGERARQFYADQGLVPAAS